MTAMPGAPRTIHRGRKVTEFDGERRSPVMQALVLLITVASLAYFLVPVYWLIVASTKTPSVLFSSPGFLFSHFDLWGNLVALNTHDGGIFWRWMLNSAIFSGLGAVLTAAVSTLCGYALAVYRFRGRRIVLGAVLGSMLVPGTVLAQPTYVMLTHVGLVNTYAGVLVPGMVYPFGVMLAYVFAQSAVPGEILEAARLDGANEFRVFWSIGLRLMRSGLVTVLLFAFLAGWNNYILPLLVLNDVQIVPVTVGLLGWLRQSVSQPGLQGLLVVGALVSATPVVAIFLALQRFWKAGISAGGLRL